MPSLVITQATSNLIKSQLSSGQTVLATVNPLNSIPLAGSMVGSSARGPGYSYNAIKPDIGAPGGSVSAEVGTASMVKSALANGIAWAAVRDGAALRGVEPSSR